MALFSNQATLSYNGTTINSNTVTGNIVEVISATKTALSAQYSEGEKITYIISITNSGSIPFTGLTLSDNLGEYNFSTDTLVPLDYVDGSVAYYQNGIQQPSPTPVSTTPFVISGITVPAGGNSMIIYETEANEYAPLSSLSTITNEATISGSGLTTPVNATETITVIEAPDLSITKSLSPTTVSENGIITYTFTVQNSGNAPTEASGGLVIEDTFTPILSNITVTVDGVTIPASSYTYNEATGEFATLPGVLSVSEATFTQDPVSGEITVVPASSIVTVTGTI